MPMPAAGCLATLGQRVPDEASPPAIAVVAAPARARCSGSQAPRRTGSGRNIETIEATRNATATTMAPRATSRSDERSMGEARRRRAVGSITEHPAYPLSWPLRLAPPLSPWHYDDRLARGNARESQALISGARRGDEGYSSDARPTHDKPAAHVGPERVRSSADHTGRKVLLEAQEDAEQLKQLKQLIARLQHG